MAEEIEGLHLDITVGTSGAEKKLEDIRREVDEVGKAAESSGKSVDDFAKAAQNILQAMNRLTEATDKNTAAQEQANRVMAEASKSIDRTGDAAEDAAESTKELGEETEKTAGKMGGSLKTLTKYAAGFFTLQAAQAFARKVFDVRSEIQSLHTSFETLLGDKGQADQLFSSIREFATSTPMQLNNLASAARTMIGFNIPLEQVMGNLKAIGDVSGGDAQKFQSLTLAFSQMSATGKLMGQDLLQMINAGFNPLAVMAEKTGKSMSKLKEEMSAGSITADMVRQAFIDATSEGGKFHNALEGQSKTITGQISNIQDAMDMMFNDIGKQSEGIINEGLGAVSYMVEHYKEIGKAVLAAATAFGAYKAALMVTVAATNAYQKLNFSSQIKALDSEINALIPAQEASANADLQEAVAKGKLTEAQAVEIAQRRELLGQMQAESTASGMTGDLDSQINQMRELLGLKEESKYADLDEMVAKGQLTEAQALEISNRRDVLEALSAEKEKRQSVAEAALEAAYNEKEAAEEAYERLSGYADAAEEAYSAALDLGDEEEIEAAREKMLTAIEAQNTAEKRLNTATTQVKTAQEELNSLSTANNTTQTAANTTATGANTVAIEGSTFAQRMHTVSTKAAALAQGVLTKAIAGVRIAFDGLKTAIMTNPIGMLIGAVSLAWPLIDKLTGKTDEQTEAQNKFSESVDKATAKVKSLYATLSTVNKGSKVSADTAKELKQIADEYGVKLDDEADKTKKETDLVEQLTNQREKLIDAIKRETIERDRANQQKGIEETYADSIQSARDAMKEALPDNLSDYAKNDIANLFSDEDINRWARAQKVLNDAASALHNNQITQAQYQEVLWQFNDVQKSVQDRVMDYIHSLEQAEGEEGKYALKTDEIKDAALHFMGATVKSTNAMESSKVALANATLAQSGLIKEQDAASVSADILRSKTDALITLWNNANPELRLKVHYDDSEIPQWMKGMTDEALKKSLIGYQNALNDKDATQFKVKGGNISREEALRRVSMMQQIVDSRKPVEAPPPKTTPTGKTKTKKTGKGSTWDAKKAAYERDELLRKWAEEMEELNEELSNDITDAQIENMDEGTQRTLAKIEEDERREVKALQKALNELIEKRKELDKQLWLKSAANRKEEDFKAKSNLVYMAEIFGENPDLYKELEVRRSLITSSYNKQREEVVRTEKDAMTAYLKEYGTMQQKRLAIAQEYDEKIRKAQTDGARLQAIAEKEMALKAFDKANADKLIDWEGIFGNLTLYTTQELEHFKNVLREKLSDNATDVEGYKTIVEQINSINEAIVGNEEKQNTFLGMYIRRGTERLKLERELNEAKEQQAQAEKDAAEKQAAYESAQSGAQTLFGMYGYKGDASNQEGVLSYFRDKFGADTKEYDIASQALNKLQESALDAENAQEKQTEATRRVTTAERQLDGFLGDFAKVLNDAMPTIQQVVDNISSLPDLLGNLGVDADSKVGQAASGLADTANSAMGAMQDYMNGNYIGAASKALDALGSFGDTLGAIGIGGFGSSDADLHKDIERLTQSNQNLQKAIDAMSSELQDADIFESVDIYKQQMEYLRQNTKNTQEMMRRAGAAYSNGFLGVKGQGSSNKKINQGMTSAEWQQISKIAGRSVSSATQFWGLTQEQMYKVMTYANGAWTHLQDLANDGMEDASQWMEEYANGYKQAEELQQQLNEKLTSVSFDSVFDSFKSMVSDMDSTAFDFSKNFEQYMYNAMLNAQLDDTFKERMKDWHQLFSDYMANDGSIDSREMEILRTDYMNMADEAKKIRDNVAEITGYSTSSQQSTTYTASQSFTQEQGDVLNGRLTAIQIGVQQQGALAQQIQASLAAMNAIVTGNGGTMTEMRNILLIQNNYLDDIARQTKSIYEEFGQKIDRLVTNTNNL